MQGNTQCARCRAEEESVNHVFFCPPPAIQVWTLLRYPRTHSSFPLNQYLQIRTICFGGLNRPWKIISLHGSFGTFGKLRTIRFLTMQIQILMTLYNQEKRNQHFGMRHMYHYKKAITLERQRHLPYLKFRKMVFYTWFMESS